MENLISQNTNRKNLLQLIWLRLIAIFGQIITILFAYYFLEISLPLSAMLVVIFAITLVNFFSFYRYKSAKNISNKSLFFELLFDVGAFTIQLYLSGGSSNPFISLFLLQVIIGAILLSQIYAWLVGIITIFCYLILSFNYRHLHIFHNHQGDNFFNLHLQGMLISYILSTILLLIFVTKIIKNLQERDQKINTLKQQALEKEQIVKMGLFTTSAAHELGTPLSTIAVIIDDWKNLSPNKSLAKDIKNIEKQIDRCKNILSQILDVSGQKRLEKSSSKMIKKAFNLIVKEWSESRKPNNLIYDFSGKKNGKIILEEDAKLALFNIFDNALEASPNFVSIKVEARSDKAFIIIEDRGTGFKNEILKEVNQNIFSKNLSTKNSSGMGLFLSINIFDSIGAKMEIKNLEKGAIVKISIPIINEK